MSLDNLRELEASNPVISEPDFELKAPNVRKQQPPAMHQQPGTLWNQERRPPSRTGVRKPLSEKAVNKIDHTTIKHETDDHAETKLLQARIRALEERNKALEKISEEVQDLYKNDLNILQSKIEQHKNEHDTQLYKEKESLAAKMGALETINAEKQKTIQELSETLRTLGNKLSSTTEALEKSVRNNRFYLEKAEELDEMLKKTELKLIDSTRDKERAERWVAAYKGAIDDYESCLRELGLYDLSVDMKDDTTLLRNQVKKLSKTVQEYKTNAQVAERRLAEQKDDGHRLSQRYLRELDMLKEQLTSAVLDRDSALEKADKCAQERDRAMANCTRATREADELKQVNARLHREHEEALTALTIKSKEQLVTIREQFDLERQGLQIQIEQLRQSKVELQAEVGQLLRTRRLYQS
ncbi:hypothetical protein EDD86DRAFT_269547 [Gorgonomyces haynaldii]|nr:hypothetical protein EDD86DRAFT_269547 [Gorgonomyces haynaldii]